MLVVLYRMDLLYFCRERLLTARSMRCTSASSLEIRFEARTILGMRLAMASWLGMDHRTSGWEARAMGASTIYDDGARRHTSFSDDEILWPCFVGLSMGWPWSLFVGQEMATRLATQNLRHGRMGLAAERLPPPQLRA